MPKLNLTKADTIAHENRSVTCGSCSSPVDDLNKDFCNSCAEYWENCEKDPIFEDYHDYQFELEE
tara:strand:+ start:2190 stop:2384 length:195 start_codon:yes stop_codon:yes gene_type:complete